MQWKEVLCTLPLHFQLTNIPVPSPVLLWLSSHQLMFNFYISVFTSRHSIQEKRTLPSKYLKLKQLMLHGFCGSGQQFVWCGVVWRGVVWYGVMWYGMVWCVVVWCGEVWCGVAWHDVVWCGTGH